MPKHKKKPAGIVYMYSSLIGLGYPAGYRPPAVHLFARYKNYLWEITLESDAAHKYLHHSEGGSDHVECGPGSVMFSDVDPLVALSTLIQSAKQAESPLEYALKKLIPRGNHTKEQSVNMVIRPVGVSWETAETAVVCLMSMLVDLPQSLQFIWIDRDDATEEQSHREKMKERLQDLARGVVQPTMRVSAEEVAKATEQNESTIEEVREHLTKKGFEEQEDGSFLKGGGRVNHGLAETFEARLTAVAKQLGYSGEMLMSPLSWPLVRFVAGGEFMVGGSDEHRAWFGYLKRAKTLVVLYMDSRIPPEVRELPDDPDFLPVMNPVVSEVEEKPLR